jgi:hypothetical protein
MNDDGRPDSRRHSLPLGLTKTVLRRAVDILLTGVVTYLLATASGFIRANWRIVLVSVLMCLAFLLSAVMRWTRVAINRAHARAPSNLRLLAGLMIVLALGGLAILPATIVGRLITGSGWPATGRLWLGIGSLVAADVAINVWWGIRHPGRSVAPGDPPFFLVPPLRHLRMIWREAICYVAGTLGSLPFCRSRDWRLRRHAVQSILIDMATIWSFGLLLIILFAVDRLNIVNDIETNRVAQAVFGGGVVAFVFIPRLVALARLWHGGGAALPMLWKMATGLTQPANRFDEAGRERVGSHAG